MHEILTPHLAKDLIARTGDISEMIRSVQKCLHIYPPVKVKIHICKTDREVQQKHRKLFGDDFNGRAFTQLSTGTIYISIQKRWFSTPLQEVLAHEIAHVLIESHFGKNMVPYAMHEREAQFAHSNYRRLMA